MKSILLLLSVFITVQSLAFSRVEPEKIYNGASGGETSLSEVINRVEAGDVIVLSELHGLPGHHQKQIKFLKALRKKGFSVSVGMEHLFYLKQEALNQYLSGDIFEKDFLSQVSWGGTPFDFYRYQVNFPLTAGGTTIALKAPQRITRKVASKGMESLTEEELQFIPPNFELGSESYFKRFIEAMGGHGNPDNFRKYFEAQSIWDESMAWKTITHMEKNPNQVFVLIVGDFHASYFGGLPDRLRTRGQNKLTVISQVNIKGLKSGDAEKEVFPSAEYGPRGDYVWVTSEDFPGESNKTTILASLGVF